MVHNIIANYREKFLADNITNIIIDGADSLTSTGLLFDKSPNSIIDASTLQNDVNLIVGNFDGSDGQTIAGSNQNPSKL